MAVDTSLREGGLEEVAEIKRKNPPKKGKLMSVLKDIITD